MVKISTIHQHTSLSRIAVALLVRLYARSAICNSILRLDVIFLSTFVIILSNPNAFALYQGTL